MTEQEKYRAAFDQIPEYGMRPLDAEQIMNAGKRKNMTPIRKTAVIAAAVILCFGISNGITYAASGNAWIVGVWQHMTERGSFNGSAYTEDTSVYTGNGFKLQIVTIQNDEDDRPLGFGIVTEGVALEQRSGSFFLCFGENEIDLTDQIGCYEKDEMSTAAVAKIDLNGRLIVAHVVDNREYLQYLKEKEPNAASNQPEYMTEFYEYEAFIKSIAPHIGKQFADVLENAEVFYAK